MNGAVASPARWTRPRQEAIATRAFPLLFFDPTLIAVDPPADLTQRSWTVATSAAGDPTFVLAARGARRSLVVVGAGVALLALSLLATARAARASAAVATRARRLRRHGHPRAEDAALNDSGGRRNAGARTRQDRSGSEPVRASARARRTASDAPREQPARLFARDRCDGGVFVRGPGTGSAHFRSDAGVPPAADRQRRSARRRRAARRPGGSRRSDGHRPRPRQPDRQRDSIFRRGRNRVRARVRPRRTTCASTSSIAGRAFRPTTCRRSGGGSSAGATARGPGNGLGLAIVNRIAADHGGALEITSEVGRGTTATLIIPKAAIGMRPRILIVEDDSSLAQILRDNLIVDGFDVEWAAQADRALVLYRSFVPDLVLLDVMLPDLSGFELARVLRHGGKTPIIILSARGEKADKLTGLRLGADDYITKPFDMEELVARINTVLRRDEADDLRDPAGRRHHRFRSGTATGRARRSAPHASRVRDSARARRARVPVSCFAMSSSGKSGAFSIPARPARSIARCRACGRKSRPIRERPVFCARSTAMAIS